MSEEEGAAAAAARRGGEDGDGGVFRGCFSGLEVAMEGRSLRELDPEKLKNEIRKWAKAVVAYARQLSGSFAGAEEKSTSE